MNTDKNFVFNLCSPVLICGLLFFLSLATPRPAWTQIPGIATPTPSPAPKPVEHDPLGRDSPYNCIIGFLKAADRGEFARAAEYLEMPASAQTAERARQLQAILNAGLSPGLEWLSQAPEGDRGDGLSEARERVGTVRTNAGSLDVVLRRVERTGQPPVWLVSSETLQRVPALFAQLDEGGIERFVPKQLREIRVFSLPLYRWLGTLAGVLFALGIAWMGTRLLFPLVPLLARRITREPDDRRLRKLRAPLWVILFAAGFRTLAIISVTVLGRRFWIGLAIAIALLGVTWLVIRCSDIAWELAGRRFVRNHMEGKLAVLSLLHRLFKISVALAGVIALVYASGRDATAILAGVGLGGIAIAFAAQKTLENLFGGVSVISDEAIRVGDFCRFADKFGTVEDIGLRSTRVRTLDRTILSIPNGQLSLMTLENFTLRDKFLLNEKIELRYETTPAQLRGILAEIRDMLWNHPSVDREDARAQLMDFGVSGFTIEVFVYLIADGYLNYLEIQEDLLMGILDLIVAGGSGLAYPTRTMYMARNKPVDSRLIEQAGARARERRNQIQRGPAMTGPACPIRQK